MELDLRGLGNEWKPKIRCTLPSICSLCVTERHLLQLTPFGTYLLVFCEHGGTAGLAGVPAEGDRLTPWQVFGPTTPAALTAWVNMMFDAMARSEGYDPKEVWPPDGNSLRLEVG